MFSFFKSKLKKNLCYSFAYKDCTLVGIVAEPDPSHSSIFVGSGSSFWKRLSSGSGQIVEFGFCPGFTRFMKAGSGYALFIRFFPKCRVRNLKPDPEPGAGYSFFFKYSDPANHTRIRNSCLDYWTIFGRIKSKKCRFGIDFSFFLFKLNQLN